MFPKTMTIAGFDSELQAALDDHIIGQADAKRAVAIALRNRWRRQQVAEPMRTEITPKNILMIGPTGVGKTEIARRLAKLAQAPFIKVEATKFTEVGYVGRDVESIIRDLTDLAVNMVKEEEKQKVEIKAHEVAEERVLDLLLPPGSGAGIDSEAIDSARVQGTREKLKKMLREGKMDDRFVDIEITQSSMPMIEVLTPQGMEGMEFNLKEMFSNLMPKKTKKKTVKIPEALEILTQEEAGKLVDMDKVTSEAVAEARLVGAMHPVAVEASHADVRDVAVPGLAAEFRQLDALGVEVALEVVGLVEPGRQYLLRLGE